MYKLYQISTENGYISVASGSRGVLGPLMNQLHNSRDRRVVKGYSLFGPHGHFVSGTV